MGAVTKPKPTGALVEASFIKLRPQFDSVPFANLSLVDVARILDVEMAKKTLNVDTVSKLIDRVLSGLSHTLIATSGRPQGTRLALLLQRGFNRLLSRISEFSPEVNENLRRLHPIFAVIETPLVVSSDPLDEKLVLANYAEYSHLVADAYDARPAHDPMARASYAALLAHTKKMFRQLLSRVRIEFTDDCEPYKDAADMTKRVAAEGVMYVSKCFSQNLANGWTPVENWMSRAVHDHIVHIGGHHDFSLRGEMGTYNRHAKLVPPAALPALFSEIVGQVSYAIVRGHFPDPQKACVLYGFDYKAVGRVDPEAYKLNWTEGL